MSADPTSKTALDLIKGALRLIGQYAPGESLSADDANDGLDSLNGLLDVLSTQNLAIFNNNENITTLVAGQSAYTVGVGGNINIQRPLRITQAYSRLTTSGSSVDFQCDIKDTAFYASIGMKNQPGPWPKVLYYNTSFPLAQLFVWPVPQRAIEFHFWTDMLMQSVSLTTQLALPQGYYLALQFALAEILAPQYGVAVSADARRLADRYMKAIKSNNSSPDRLMVVDGAIATTGAADAGFYLTGGF